MSITQITDHAIQAKNRLIQQYKGRERIELLIDCLFGEQIQEVEDALVGMDRRLNIDLMSGVQLDGIGEIVGQPRAGMSDATYKLFLKGRIGKNTSEGTLEEVIQVWKLITSANEVQALENYPAEIQLFNDAAIDAGILDAAYNLINEVAMGGVLVHSVGYYLTGGFGFSGTSSAYLGFGSVYDADLGGKLASIQKAVS